MNQDEPSEERCKFVVKGMGKFVDFLGPIKDYGKMHVMEVVEILYIKATCASVRLSVTTNSAGQGHGRAGAGAGQGRAGRGGAGRPVKSF